MYQPPANPWSVPPPPGKQKKEKLFNILYNSKLFKLLLLKKK